ncbi:FecR domain-containing protein, partial [Rhodospirillales bacterium]|nr:FecR domain-containing protein [Rhodospirillales bacterium]
MDTLVTTETDVRVIDTAGTEQVPVGELGWLQGAEFVRIGPDLMLVGEDGAQVLLQDYFMQPEPSDLLATNGGIFDAQLVARLAGPMAPGQVAQTTPTSAEPIGQVDTIEGAVDAARADGTKVKLAKGDPVFQGDVIETGEKGSVGLILADDSTFSIGEDGRVVLDEMVYDADAQTGSLKVDLVQGVLSFVSGQIAKTDPDAMTLNTAVASIGIRGTTGVLKLPAGEPVTVALAPNADGTVGEITVTNDSGTQVLNQPFQGVQVASLTAPISQPFIIPAADFSQQFGAVVSRAQAAETRAATVNQQIRQEQQQQQQEEAPPEEGEGEGEGEEGSPEEGEEGPPEEG